MLPFDGAISKFFDDEAPKSVRNAIKGAKKNDMLDASYPYAERMDKTDYEDTLLALQIELAKWQADVKAKQRRVAVIFEGRDAAGKGGSIKRVRENLNPRVASVVALSKPTDLEARQWYFQRYIAHLPAGGEIKLFDRSWYNRGVVEHVFGFCSEPERESFFGQTPDFEDMLIGDGIDIVKIWLNVGRAEQLRRFLDRESDPLKSWKLSSIDVAGLAKWDAYTDAIAETLDRTNRPHAPWTVIRSDDKRRARIDVIRRILSHQSYAGKDEAVVRKPDPKLSGGPEMLDRHA
ncbi:MAG: polyphosphate kinase 2 [Pseudomonadota bacterium]